VQLYVSFPIHLHSVRRNNFCFVYFLIKGDVMGRELALMGLTGIKKNYPEIVNGIGHVGYIIFGTVVTVRCLSKEIHSERTHWRWVSQGGFHGFTFLNTVMNILVFHNV